MFGLLDYCFTCLIYIIYFSLLSASCLAYCVFSHLIMIPMPTFLVYVLLCLFVHIMLVACDPKALIRKRREQMFRFLCCIVAGKPRVIQHYVVQVYSKWKISCNYSKPFPILLKHFLSSCYYSLSYILTHCLIWRQYVELIIKI